MTFDANELSVLAYANGFTLWHYRSDDAAAEVGQSGYFRPAREMLRAGDVIIASSGDGAGGGLLRVTEEGGAVAIGGLPTGERGMADGAS